MALVSARGIRIGQPGTATPPLANSKIQLPSMTMDTVEVDYLAGNINIGTTSCLLDARPAFVNGSLYQQAGNNGVWQAVYSNGVQLGTSVALPYNQRVKIKAVAPAPFTTSLPIFANYVGNYGLIGEVYGVACYLNGQVVAKYEFLEGQGSVLYDTSGNGNHATITGGTYTWIQKNTKGISPEKATVRTLPNGVADQVINGEYVKNVEVNTFNGAESWATNGSYPNQATSIVFALSLPKAVSNWTIQKSTCDKFTWKDNLAIWNNDNAIGYNIDGIPSLIVRIERAKLSTADVAGFKAWLAQNPITLTYQLATQATTLVTPRAVKTNVKNLVTNGNFANGTTGWLATSSSFSVSGGIATTRANARYGGIYQQNTYYPANHKIYTRAKMKATSNQLCIRVYDGVAFSSGFHTGSGQFETVSVIVTMNNGTYLKTYTVDDRASGWDDMQVTDIMTIDLTEKFGVGKEPDLVTCDKLFANFFDGAAYLQALTRIAVMVPKKNLFDGKLESSTIATADGQPVAGYPDKIRTLNFISINPGKQYTISNDKSYADITVYWYGISRNYISSINIPSSNPATVTAPSNAFYAKFRYTGTDVSAKVLFEEGATATAYEPYQAVNRPAINQVNLWAKAGKPTSYSSLPLSPSHPGIYIQAMSYKMTFKAKSNSGAVIRIFDLWTAQYGSSLVSDFQLTSNMIQCTVTWVEANPSNMVYLSDKNSIGDIVIQDIELTQVR